MYICLGKACNFYIYYVKKGQGGLMVMTLGFHPGDPGSIPLIGNFYFTLILIHIFNVVHNSLSTTYYYFQHSVH